MAGSWKHFKIKQGNDWIISTYYWFYKIGKFLSCLLKNYIRKTFSKA